MGIAYEVEGDMLCIRIPVDALAENAQEHAFGPAVISDRVAFAKAVGRELCDTEDAGGMFHLVKPVHEAIVRLIESADETISFKD